MNTLFYGFQFPHHGRFSAFSALSREMKGEGMPVCETQFPSMPPWLPGRIRAPLAKKWFQANEYRLKKEFTSGSLIHYFFPENSLFKAPKWKKDGPLVLSCHQPAETLRECKQKGYLTPFFGGLKAADAVILMASVDLDAYREFAPHSRILCIPHGVDTDFFSPQAIAQRQDGKFRILTVGNWLRDYDLWAKVVERVAAECPEVEFSVLANPDILKSATGNLTSSRDRVRILQGISDEQLRDEYRRADVIFLPLLDAWANNALLEGMACGRPVVATDLPAIREYAGDAAVFIEKGSVDAAVAQLLRLRGEADAVMVTGAQARKRVVSEFSWTRIVQQHIGLYAELM